MSGKNVLDMGSGTAVLAILAEMRGAAHVDAIDIDEWAFENGEENAQMNGCNSIDCFKGGAELLSDQQYDVIFANINRNILLRDMHAYASVLKDGGEILSVDFICKISHI
ncbi:MAG: 50S ribosomal protein L11 methyltransferase [Flavobacteriales bacterium]